MVFQTALFNRWDFLCIAVLVVLWFALLPLRYDSLPLQIWDESRLANNALEMARNGHWLIPTYDGIPDHWNTKPPLLIWQMAGLIRLGFPPLLAVRLPTMLAALITVAMVWAVGRYVVCDRAVAAFASFLLLSSLAFTEIHVARTGDYDVPMALFILLYSLAFWASLERPRDGTICMKWFAVAVSAVALAVMTKGVAGGLGLAGVLVLFFIRNRFSVLVADYRAWLLTLLALVTCASYYGLRDQYDPGYLESAWQNEVSGRFFAVNEGHVAGPGFYIYFLLYNFEPGVILLPLTAISILGDNRRRRSVVILCLISTFGILVILTSSQTKLFWYTTPVLPFLAIASAIGLVDALNLINVRAGHLPLRGLLQIALGLVLALISALSLYRNQVIEPSVAAEQGWYGALFQELKAYGNIEDILVLDNGFEGTSKNYNPVLKFYADIARADGLRIKRVTEWASAALPEDKIISTCDSDAIPFLNNLPKFLRKGSVHSCIFGMIDRESRR